MRPSRDEVYMKIAFAMASRGTCARRQVGCVLVDVDGFPLSMGYNGVAGGKPHCNADDDVYGRDFRCPGSDALSGTGLDACQAIHAEQNALIRLPDPRRVHTTYCTASPCVQCVKMLMNTACTRIVFSEEYPHPAARDWWVRPGFFWEQLK